MEPVGSFASIAGIIDILARSLSTLYVLQEKLASSELILDALIGELASTKAALRGLESTLTKHIDGIYDTQLVSDVDLSLSSCARLIAFVDSKISGFTVLFLRPKTIRKRLRVMMADEDTKVYFTHLNHIISALNVMKQNIDGYASGRHLSVPQRAQSQRIMQQVRDDRSSLVALYDRKSSLKRNVSCSTGRSSAIDAHFEFDSQLCQHPTYQHTFRSLLHRERQAARRKLVLRHSLPQLTDAPIAAVDSKPNGVEEDANSLGQITFYLESDDVGCNHEFRNLSPRPGARSTNTNEETTRRSSTESATSRYDGDTGWTERQLACLKYDREIFYKFLYYAYTVGRPSQEASTISKPSEIERQFRFPPIMKPGAVSSSPCDGITFALENKHYAIVPCSSVLLKVVSQGNQTQKTTVNSNLIGVLLLVDLRELAIENHEIELTRTFRNRVHALRRLMGRLQTAVPTTVLFYNVDAFAARRSRSGCPASTDWLPGSKVNRDSSLKEAMQFVQTVTSPRFPSNYLQAWCVEISDPSIFDILTMSVMDMQALSRQKSSAQDEKHARLTSDIPLQTGSAHQLSHYNYFI